MQFLFWDEDSDLFGFAFKFSIQPRCCPRVAIGKFPAMPGMQKNIENMNFDQFMFIIW